MTAQLRPNRMTVTDRFPMLGFTIRVDRFPRVAEVVLATDPALFTKKAGRMPSNFYTSREHGLLSIPAGEAVFMVPTEVLTRFVGASRLWFGLATATPPNNNDWIVEVLPQANSPYISLSGISDRALRRVRMFPVRGSASIKGPMLEWTGDRSEPGTTSVQVPTIPGTASVAPIVPSPQPAAQPATPHGNIHYDDGFGLLPPLNLAPPAPPAVGASPAPAPVAPAAQGLTYGLSSDPEAYGIDTPPYSDENSFAEAPAIASALALGARENSLVTRTAASPNFNAGRGGKMIDRIIIHITDASTLESTVNHFTSSVSQASAHYLVGQEGEVVQFVSEADTAWHCRGSNQRSIGIEHVAVKRGGADYGNRHFDELAPSQLQYETSAALVASLCDKYSLPINRTTIMGHREADTSTGHTSCPDGNWDWEYFMRLVNSRTCQPQATSQGLVYAIAQDINTPFYDPADPASALRCQNDAFSSAREEWFAGVPDTTVFPHSSICRINRNDGGFGTGFYIGRNRILTAAHVLDGATSVTIVPGLNNGSTTPQPFGSCTVQNSSWRIPARYLSTPNRQVALAAREHDIAVIDNVPLGAPNNRWFEFLNATPSDRLPIVVCGYSQQSRRVPELTAAIDGGKQHLHGGYAHSMSNGELIEYPILTLAGASGSPIYTLSGSSNGLTAKICAVHVSSADSHLNRGCFITPNKIDWIEGRAASFALGASVEPPAPGGEFGYGVSLTRRTESSGGRSYDLAQLTGLVQPANALAGGAGQPRMSGQRITLDDWPYIDGPSGRISAPVTIDWAWQGGAVGDVAIAPGGGQVLDGWIAQVRADISRAPGAPEMAQVKVRITTTFRYTGVEDQVAVTEVAFNGNGRFQITHGADNVASPQVGSTHKATGRELQPA